MTSKLDQAEWKLDCIQSRMDALSRRADADPCWEGYEQRGTKEKGGDTVPNCVKADADEPEADEWVQRAQKQIICDTGQLGNSRKALDKMVAKGRLEKWRGYWHPVTGADWGIGNLKTCYGPKGSQASLPPGRR